MRKREAEKKEGGGNTVRKNHCPVVPLRTPSF